MDKQYLVKILAACSILAKRYLNLKFCELNCLIKDSDCNSYIFEIRNEESIYELLGT